MDDGADCHLDICGIINDNRSVACAYAQCRFTGGVSCVYHARTTGCQDGIGILHDFLGQIQRWNIDPADDIFRCASLYCCVQNDLCCCDSALFCTWMWGNDDGVSGLQCDQGFKDRCRSRVSSRNYCCDQTDRLCDLLGSICLIFLDHTTGLGVLICVVNVLCCIVVFDNLILYNTHASLSNCHLC